jgi:tetratricopeptide (TPR) repeat protein
MLMQAIRLTVPRFELNHIRNFLYGTDEVKVINQIANIYSENGEHEKAANIYNQLLAYIQNHFENPQRSEGLFPLVSFDYAHELCLLKRYTEAVPIAEAGIHSMVQYGYRSVLPQTLAVLAECYYFLGNKEKSCTLYKQAYAICTVLGTSSNVQSIKKDAKKYLNIEFDY